MNTFSRAIEGIAVRRSSDAEVFDRALRGDSLAFSEVYRRYHDRIFAFCLSRLLSREAATDASQEVFLRALSADASGVKSPGSWLFGIARHVCIDIARKEQRDSPSSAYDVASDESALPLEPTAEDAALSRQAASDVLLALRRTNPRYRSALILREIHQQPMPDVAEALGVSTGAAYTILSRARDAFGTAYARVLDLPEPCRRAVELMYRRSGTGISATELGTLDAHLGSCARCRREAAKAEDGKGMRALLPLLPWAMPRAPGLLTRAATVFGTQAWPVDAISGAGAQWSASMLAMGTIATVGIIAAVVTTVPVISPGAHAERTAVRAGQSVSSVRPAGTSPPTRVAQPDPTQARLYMMLRDRAGSEVDATEGSGALGQRSGSITGAQGAGSSGPPAGSGSGSGTGAGTGHASGSGSMSDGSGSTSGGGSGSKAVSPSGGSGSATGGEGGSGTGAGAAGDSGSGGSPGQPGGAEAPAPTDRGNGGPSAESSGGAGNAPGR